MDLGIRLICQDLDDSKLSTFAREVSQSLRSARVGEAALTHAETAKPGTKGDPVTLSTIVLTLLGSGGVAVSLVQVLKAFVERKSSLRFEFTRPDGKKLEMSAENLGKESLERTARTVEAFLKE